MNEWKFPHGVWAWLWCCGFIFLIGVGSKAVHTFKEGKGLDLWDAVHRMFPLVWAVPESKELLNVSNSSKALCMDPEIPLSVITQTVEISMVVRNASASHCVPSLSFLQSCMLPTRSPHWIQSRELLIQFSFKCVEHCRRLPSCCLCFVLPTSRLLYELVWSVVVVRSCHRFLCCCCCCCSCFLAARFLAECLSSKYGLHQLCWK